MKCVHICLFLQPSVLPMMNYYNVNFTFLMHDISFSVMVDEVYCGVQNALFICMHGVLCRVMHTCAGLRVTKNRDSCVTFN